MRIRHTELYRSSSVRLNIIRKMGTDQSSLLGSDYPISLANCRIVVLGPKSGDKSLLALSQLPPEARIVATGTSLAEIQKDGDLYSEVNVPASSESESIFAHSTVFIVRVMFC